jgi:hypothetical protein
MSAELANARELDQPTRRLWSAILGSTGAFVATGSVGWLIAGVACSDATPDLGPLSGGGVRILVGLIAGAGIVATLWGLAVGVSVWRAHSPSRHLGDLEDAAGRDRYRFMAVVAILTSAVFLLGVLWEGLPPLFFDVCEAMR